MSEHINNIESGIFKRINSRELISSPSDPKLSDKVYITGEVKQHNENFQIEIPPKAPVATFLNYLADPEIADKLSGALTVQQLRLSASQRAIEIPGHEDLSLISAGAFVFAFVNGSICLLAGHRSKNAPTDPEALTGVAGRCGEKPSETILHELNQESIIIVEATDGPKVIVITKGEEGADDLVNEKLEHLKYALEYMKKQPEAEIDDDISLYESIISLNHDGLLRISIDDCLMNIANDTVVTTIDGNVLDTVKHSVTQYDLKNNTLEIVQPIFIPQDLEIISARAGDFDIRDGHYFDPVEFVPEDKILTENYKSEDNPDGQPTHPALLHLVQLLEKQRQAHTDW
ncbi:MAG: hypothetical protein WCG48_03510 [Candidatus Berkelbacteria bacterium]